MGKSKNPGAPHSATSRREHRQKEAQERQVARDARTTKEQLALIEKRRGESKREQTRIQGPRAHRRAR